MTLRRRVRWDGDEFNDEKVRERGLLAETGECTYIVSKGVEWVLHRKHFVKYRRGMKDL